MRHCAKKHPYSCCCITGADRIAGQRDVRQQDRNLQRRGAGQIKRGPFYVAAPLFTIDPSLENGMSIPIEEESSAEGLQTGADLYGPVVSAPSPSLDITPAKYGLRNHHGGRIIRAPHVRGSSVPRSDFGLD